MMLALSLGWMPPIGTLLTILIAGFILLSLLRYIGLINTRYVSVGRRALIIGCLTGVFIIWLMYRPPVQVHRLALFPLQPASASTQPEGLGIGVAHTAVDLLRLSLPSGTRVSPIDAVEQAVGRLPVIDRASVLENSARLGVRYAVFGEYDRADSMVILRAHFLDMQDSTDVIREIRIVHDRLSEAPVRLIHAITRQFPVFMTQDSTLNLSLYVPSSEVFVLYCRGQAMLHTRTSDGNWQASEAFHAALAIDSTYALPHYGLARVYNAWRRPGFKNLGRNAAMRRKAIERAKTAVIMNPRLNEAYRVMADIYMNQKQWKNMGIALKQAIAADPLEPLNYVALSHMRPDRFQDMGYRDEAELCEQAVRLNPDSIILWVHLVNGYIEAGKLRDARIFAEEALALAPASVEMLEAMGIAYNYAMEPYSAIEIFQRAIELDPYDQELYYGLATAYSISLNDRGAIETYEKGIVVLPDNADLYYNLGVLYQRIGEWEQAISWFERAIEVGNHTDAHFYMARWYEKQGNRQKAVEHWRQRILLGEPTEEWTREAIRRLKILSPSTLPAIGVIQ